MIHAAVSVTNCSFHNLLLCLLLYRLRAVTETVKDVTHRAADATKKAVHKPSDIDPEVLAFQVIE
jgi:hypothetical protein